MKCIPMLTAVTFLASICIPSCTQTPEPPTGAANEPKVGETREEAIQTLREADQAWSRASSNANVEEFLSLLTEEAMWLYCNRPTMDGKEEIRLFVRRFMARPGYTLTFEPERIDVGTAGDMGYTAGNWQSRYEDSDGQLTEDSGSYLAIWKKGENGQWKVVVEIDLPGQTLLPTGSE